MSTSAAAGPTAPLAGIRVISLAEQYPGPFATLLLGDLGADVIQIERPHGGDPSRAFPGLYQALNRGKRSVALDLKDSDALSACRALVATADVMLEGFRPGVLGRLGLGHDDLAQLNPALVYVSVSGFGQSGPLRDLPAHDLTFQALAGLLDADEPRIPHLALADLFAGMFTAFAAVTGVLSARNTGHGGYYDVAMFDTLLTVAATRLVPRVNALPADTLGLDPGYGFFAAADGTWVSLSIAFEDHFWAALCSALDMPDAQALSGPQRVEQRDALQSAIAQRIAAMPADHWDVALAGSGVPYGRLNGVDDILADPHVGLREMFQSIRTRDGEQQTFVRQPLLVDGIAHGPSRGVPQLGEHTAELLAEVGIDPAVVNRLVAPLSEPKPSQIY
ncbi:CaiB/BaiF CoA-transferase family protein [Nocardia sp. NPDC005745]|uniref:CaiB/BaiF CoA transferase family protein n=1 Tax=Nocardia sp. NPDC005745 TaxID=3157061 RepID=UPI0033C59E5A